jgi:uncharacterized protein
VSRLDLNVPWGISDSIVIFLMAWIVLPFFAIMGLSFLAPGFPLIKTFLNGVYHGDIVASFIVVIFEVIAAIVLLRHYLKRAGASWRDLGLRRFNVLKAIAYVIIAFIVFGILVAVAYAVVKALLPAFNPTQPQTNEFTKANTPATQQISFLALVIIPPIIEEMVFRGFMFPAFAKRFGVVGGTIIASLLFGLAHWQGNVTVYTFMLGLLLCFMYYRLRSIVPGIALHMLNNYLAYMTIIHK